MMKQHYTVLSDEALDLVATRFHVLGEPMRLRLVRALADGEKNVTELVAISGASQANVSKHLSILTQNGVVYKRRDGANTYYGVADESIFRLCDIVCGGLHKQFQTRVKAVRP